MDKAKKGQVKKILTWAVMAGLVLILAVMPLMAQQEAQEDGPVASVLSGTVKQGQISVALHGGGTLAADGAEDVTLPAEVKITEFLVKNGDTVTAGTPLAVVDKVSVMNAITQITDTMDYLQEEIDDARNEKAATTVAATAGGRVKEIYAEEGDLVEEVMLEHGALAVLSLDSMMAVKLERDMDLLAGEIVSVTLSDETQVDGRVESNLNGEIVITVEDEGYPIGEAVVVTTEDGDPVGKGELYIHNSWSATAYTGVVSNVNCKEEKKVSSGATLFTLNDTEFEADLGYLAALHREYEELMQELFQMYERGTIDAPCDGMVSGIDKDSPHLLASGEAQWEAQLLNSTSGEEKGWKIMLLMSPSPDTQISGANEYGCTSNENCPVEVNEHHEENCPRKCVKANASGVCKANKHELDCIESCDHADAPTKCDATGKHYSDCIKGCTSAKETGKCGNGTGADSQHYYTCIESCISSHDSQKDCPATGSHKKDCIESCVHADVTGVCESQYHYADCIGACKNCDGATQVCPSSKHVSTCYYANMTYTATAAKIAAVGNELVVHTDLSGTVYNVVRTSSGGWAISGGGKVNTETLVGPEASVSVSNAADFKGKEGSIILIVTGHNGDDNVPMGAVMYQAASSGNLGDLSGMLGGLGGMGGFGNLAGLLGGFSGYSYGGITADSLDKELYDLEGDVLMTVTPQDTMTVTIAIDEQDIAKVSKGMTAQVKVEALKGEVFDAVVTDVSISGANSGGSSKFPVELTLDLSGDMLEGMSATASLPLYTRMDVPVIPAAALVEDGAKTVVYTALDKETGEPTSPVEVQTGITDGENVEILSGLNNGDTFYYSYYDTLELSTEVEEKTFSFGG